MRGWSYYIGGFPSEYELFMGQKLNGDDLEIVWFFWVYLGVFGASSILAYMWQRKEMQKEGVEVEKDDDFTQANVMKMLKSLKADTDAIKANFNIVVQEPEPEPEPKLAYI